MKPAFLKSESGFVLAKVLILAGVGLAITAGTLKLIDNRVSVAKILNARARMSMLETRVINAATSLNAYYASSQRGGADRELRRCMNSAQACYANRLDSVILFNSFGEQISGDVDINGANCANRSNCATLFNVETNYQFICSEEAASCAFPELIETRYTIRQVDEKYTNGYKFPDITGQVQLATYMCPAGDFVRGIDANGKFICDTPDASLFSASCPTNSAAYGITPQGDLLCAEVVNYCGKTLALATVIDTSGSMSINNRMNSSISAGQKFVEYLESIDESGIIEFNNSSATKVNLSKSKPTLHDAFSSLRARGGTNMAAGLSSAETMLNASDPNAIKGIVFLSDGWFNVGGPPFNIANQLKGNGVKIWTIGLGTGVDAVTLRKLASTPQDYFAVPNENELQAAFDAISAVLCRK